MTPVNLFTVNHQKPVWDPTGGIVTNLIVGGKGSIRPTIADMQAQCWARAIGPSNGIIGFQGYRKHLDFRPGAEFKRDWVEMTPAEFHNYQVWQQQYAAHNIRSLIFDCDILVNPPYDVRHNGGMKEDFCVSASAVDWLIMEQVLRELGEFNFDLPTVLSYCVLTTTVPIFYGWMDFWKLVMDEIWVRLPDVCPDPGPRPDIYLPRRLAFLSERVFSLWLDSTKFKVKSIPLLVCWEYK